MSKYTTGDATDYSQEGYSAKTVVEGLINDSTLEHERKTDAAVADVQDARFIGYAEVLDVYQRRSDTEHLADRRARHYASDPEAQDFARHEFYDGVSGAVADGDPAADQEAGYGGAAMGND